jgi:hypothetical protein
MKFTLLSKRTNQLKIRQIAEICRLKNTYWNYGFNSNLVWFKNHVKAHDIHNLMYINSKLIGYTILRKKTFYIKKNKKKYLYFDTLILDNRFRNKKLSYLLMNLNKEIILKMNMISFLICLKKTTKFYKKFGWKVMNKKVFTIKDHNSNLQGMCFNNKNLNNKIKYIFYLYK